MKHILSAAALATALAFNASFAQTFDAAAYSKAVNRCVDVVNRSRAPQQLGLLPPFDAFYNPADNKLRFFGTPQDEFTFKKCMASAGWPTPN